VVSSSGFGFATCSESLYVNPPVYDLALTKVLGNNQTGTVKSGDLVTFTIIVTNQ
jgi:hypothetical protein